MKEDKISPSVVILGDQYIDYLNTFITGKDLFERLTAEIFFQYSKGNHRFLITLGVDFGMLAAEVILCLRKICPLIEVSIIIPYKGYKVRGISCSDEEKIYQDIYDISCQIIDYSAYNHLDKIERLKYFTENALLYIVYYKDLNNTSVYILPFESKRTFLSVHNLYYGHERSQKILTDEEFRQVKDWATQLTTHSMQEQSCYYIADPDDIVYPDSFAAIYTRYFEYLKSLI